MPQPFRDMIAATVSPMRADGTLDLGRVPAIVEHLMATTVTGVFVAGSTGEGPSLTTDERMELAAAYVKASAGRLRVLVHVGHNSLAEARRLAQHAQSIGAAGVAATPPSYFKPASVDGVIDCLAEVASGAPDLDFFYYHIPSMTGVQVDVAELLARGAERVPNFAGMKFTAPELFQYLGARAAVGGRQQLFWGFEEALLGALVAGATEGIGSTYTFAGALYRRLISAFAEGDLDAALDWQTKAAGMLEVMNRFGRIESTKAAMRLVGVDCGPVRLPLKTLDDGQLDQMRRGFDDIGVLEVLQVSGPG